MGSLNWNIFNKNTIELNLMSQTCKLDFHIKYLKFPLPFAC